MYCSSCGKQISDNAVICVNCGAATRIMVAYQQQTAHAPQQITVVNTNTNTAAGYHPPVVYAPVRKKTSSKGLIIAIIVFILLAAGMANSESTEEAETTESVSATESMSTEESASEE
jgi:uncharacterized membrane protein YvbJ